MIRTILIAAFLLICLVGPQVTAGDDSADLGPPGGQPWEMDNPPDFWAQAGDYPDSEPPGMQKQRRYLEQLRMLKLLEMLDLKEDQEVEFITNFRAMRQNLEDLEAEHHSILDEVSRHIDAGDVDDRLVERTSEQLVQIAQRKIEVVSSFFNEAKKTLTPEQMAKLMIFQERFDRELLERVRAFRERGMHRGNPQGKKH
jgi:hypothetical protein